MMLYSNVTFFCSILILDFIFSPFVSEWHIRRALLTLEEKKKLKMLLGRRIATDLSTTNKLPLRTPPLFICCCFTVCQKAVDLFFFPSLEWFQILLILLVK